MTTRATPKAPWRDLLTTHLSKSSTSEFSVATTTTKNKRPLPRVRTCGFRGFFPLATPQLHHSAVDALNEQGEGLNPDVYESDMFSFTTDRRMEKIGHIESGSEGGGDVEMVFWLKDIGTQWRVKGVAFVIGESQREGNAAEGRARGEIQMGLRVVSEEGRGDWSWERQVTMYFANHTPFMRGSFKNPPPGQPKSQISQDQGVEIGQKVADIHDRAARRNFRVVVVRPEEVEQLDLSDYENPRRLVWTLAGDGTKWEEVELWP